MVTREDVIGVLNNAIGCATDDETVKCLEIAKNRVRKYHGNCLVKDCLSCSNSHSEPSEDGNDILHCMEYDGRVVQIDGYCDDWN